MDIKDLKNNKDFYYVNRDKDSIERYVLSKMSFYPLGYGYLKISDNNLYVVTSDMLNDMFYSLEEAEDSLYNLFTII